MSRTPRWTIALGLGALVGCANLGHYVWVQDYEQPGQPQKAFVIRPGDVIQLRMFGQDHFNTRAKVREDGRISLPLLTDVEAAGYTPVALGRLIETRYKDFVKVPSVTISVEEVRPLAVSVAGEVVRAGVVSAERGATLLQVLLLAGGPNDFAHRDRIFVLRTSPSPARIRFSWEALLRGDGPGARFEVRPGDSVVVE
jgi:polysaccharide export outer membrane protein